MSNKRVSSWKLIELFFWRIFRPFTRGNTIRPDRASDSSHRGGLFDFTFHGFPSSTILPFSYFSFISFLLVFFFSMAPFLNIFNIFHAGWRTYSLCCALALLMTLVQATAATASDLTLLPLSASCPVVRGRYNLGYLTPLFPQWSFPFRFVSSNENLKEHLEFNQVKHDYSSLANFPVSVAWFSYRTCAQLDLEKNEKKNEKINFCALAVFLFVSFTFIPL